MPASGARLCRNISPCSICAGVVATSTVKRCGPPAVTIVSGAVGKRASCAAAVPGSMHQFMPSSETLLAIFLPPLLFEAALNIDVRQLSDEIGPILLLAVVGVVVCTFTAGFTLAPISDLGLLPCIALGAIIATTDPVAVVGVFRAVGAPRRLATLVEGES